MISEATRRARRVATVRRLVGWRDSVTVTGPIGDRLHSLTWPELDALPLWCALDDAALSRLIPLAGAVSLLPGLRRCVHGPTLRHLASQLGYARLHALRTRPYRSAAECALSQHTDLSNLLQAQALDAQLHVRGVQVLLAVLEDPALKILAAGALSTRGAPNGKASANSTSQADGWGESEFDGKIDVQIDTQENDASACPIALELLAMEPETDTDTAADTAADTRGRSIDTGRAA